MTNVPEAASSNIASSSLTPASTGAAPTPAASGTVPFDILAQGEPLVGQGNSPLTLAIRGDSPNRQAPEELPDMAREALQKALATAEPALYIVVYAGAEPSSGYQVKIDSISARTEAGHEKLVVNYSLEKPQSGQGGANVRTHPFIIARVSDTSVQPDDVLFNGP